MIPYGCHIVVQRWDSAVNNGEKAWSLRISMSLGTYSTPTLSSDGDIMAHRQKWTVMNQHANGAMTRRAMSSGDPLQGDYINQ